MGSTKQIKIEIRNRWTGSVVFEYTKEGNTITETVLEAIRRGADLRDADLCGADLRGANLRDANLRGADHDKNFVYTVGATVEVPDFDDNRWSECAPGIHFFIDRRAAVEY